MDTYVRTSGQLGPLLRRLRLDRKLSQRALGQKIGLPQERISRIESCPESITVDRLLDVLMALDAEFVIQPRTKQLGKATPSADDPGGDELETW